MPRTAFTRLRSRRDLVVGLLLAVFALRAFVPAGYMPSTGPSLLELCRAGFPATVLVYGDAAPIDPASPGRDSDHTAGEHCLFAAHAAAPPLRVAEFVSPLSNTVGLLAVADSPFVDQSLHRAQQARGPPARS